MFKATLNPLSLEIKLPDSAFGTCLGMVVVFGLVAVIRPTGLFFFHRDRAPTMTRPSIARLTATLIRLGVLKKPS